MAIKQRTTPVDAVLLKFVLPLLHDSGLRKYVLRWQLWHHPARTRTASSPVLILPTRLSAQGGTPSRVASALEQKRAA